MKYEENKDKCKKIIKTKPKKDKIKFIVSREYQGTQTFSELFEPIVEMMISKEISGF